MIKPEAISFPTSDNSTAHGLLYLASDNNGKRENAPVVMYVHGGPTGMATNNFNSIIQYLATRGYAVFAINHRGSIGYGKDYREVLNCNWGTYDVNDTIDALNYLAKQGLVNKNKSCILGGSAGGFTVLMSLVKKPGIYSAGVDLFGVSDNFGLAEDTHYLESRYSDILLGPLPEASQKYVEQSAIFHADKISDPLLIFQGADDKVVPKNQSELIKSKVKGYVINLS
jgi:dipeptidyl aminopeptidase/acylaminoacyl peptidase